MCVCTSCHDRSMIGWSMLPENNPSQAVPSNFAKTLTNRLDFVLPWLFMPFAAHGIVTRTLALSMATLWLCPMKLEPPASDTSPYHDQPRLRSKKATKWIAKLKSWMESCSRILPISFWDFFGALPLFCLPTRHPRCVQLNAWWCLIAFRNQDSSSSSSFSILTWRISLAPRGCNEKHQPNCNQEYLNIPWPWQ